MVLISKKYYEHLKCQGKLLSILNSESFDNQSTGPDATGHPHPVSFSDEKHSHFKLISLDIKTLLVFRCRLFPVFKLKVM